MNCECQQTPINSRKTAIVSLPCQWNTARQRQTPAEIPKEFGGKFVKKIMVSATIALICLLFVACPLEYLCQFR